MDPMTHLATPAWWMAGGLRNVPGVLVAGEGKLAFVTDDGPVFSAPITEVGPVAWPWHWFGGGCRITVGADRYNITFVRPNGAPAASPHLLESAQSLATVLSLGAVPSHSVAGLFDVRSGRAAGKAWKQVLPG
jgi:hypothetical protein